MAEIVSREEDSEQVEFVYRANPNDVDTIKVTVHKTDPPSWCIEQNTGKTWQEIVADLDTDLGVI